MTEDEKLALNYHIYTCKSSDSPYLRNMMIEKGWISTDPKIAHFLSNGYEEFELNIARRIMNEFSKKVFFNNCPKCDKLARTPYAKQCRYCGYSWHHLIVAHFKINSVFQVTGRKLFFIGQIIDGKIKEGQQMDLRIWGLDKKLKIESIELALKRQDKQAWEDIALGTSELTEEEKQALQKSGNFPKTIDIIESDL
ncbi:hypothetical protein C1631_001590 [Chryseobacterium phosphatilyticum]|uniref:Uncharacterized protein n=2 Tax=Chryseobacterium phosphatilyticum TaxID=475075 RepID=A0A316XC18_9FLAO|nr:hypothetical protein C1631_001590 [Chryseobacterium phosphatilyticum]